ncbi:RCC1 repeat-containing [Hyphodiscus hymeniophilus]|uniref:RCC1 repeat-containing n=1 Tax=Hyphodiscus hymeniophilus TaxID=353542 RepID=A0A9P6VIZ9_9HELO|nr:RCC1 repeat-containing [Hyphodiscus hymeniophilus]
MSAIYAIGSNGSGQLGIGHKEDVSVPKPVLLKDISLEQTTKVRGGGNHTILLSFGTLYCSGDPISGACGIIHDAAHAPSQFREVNFGSENAPANYSIRFCAASWESSIIVQEDENGKATQVYAFGTGYKGELGLGDFIFKSAKAQLIEDFPPAGLEVVDLAASVSHVVAVLSNGEAYGWGSGRKGQLGEPEGVIYGPRKVTGANFKVIRAVCGREFTYLLGEPREGQHVVLGSDKWNARSSAPAAVPNWKDVGASWGSIFVLQGNGKLLAWGRDDHGQLPTSEVPPLSQIAIGSEHAVGLTENQEVLAWGWGEHGNCGPKTANGDVKGRWNVIASSQYLPQESKISSIGAGCATSWVCITG